MHHQRVIHLSNQARGRALMKALYSGIVAHGESHLLEHLHPFWEEFVLEACECLRIATKDQVAFSELTQTEQFEQLKNHPILSFDLFVTQFQEMCARVKALKCGH